MAVVTPLWLILLTVVVFALVFSRGDGSAVRKLLLVLGIVGFVFLGLGFFGVYASRNVGVAPALPYPDYGAGHIQIDNVPAPPALPTLPSPLGAGQGGSPASGGVARINLILIALPALAALAALAAIRHAPSTGRRRTGLVWLAGGTAVLVLLGFSMFRTRQIAPPMVAAQQVFDAVASGDTANRALIDEQWERLTAPHIPLDLPQPAPDASVQISGAAESLQSASEQIAEAASEGWIVAATRALVNAKAKPQAVKASSASAATPAAAPIAARPPKPDWVLRSPGLVGNVRKIVVATGPYQTVEECHRELEDKLRGVVLSRVIELATAAAGRPMSTPSLETLNIGTDYILRELCPEPEFIEDVEASFGPMKKAYVLIEFTEAQDAELLNRWISYGRTERLAVAAFAASLVVGCVALAYGLLKVDTWTRGYYSKRLFLGVPAAIIGVVALLAMLT